jgi:Protein of unknown function (DUF2849)
MKHASKVLTANRLSDGIVVWYAHPQQWIEAVESAYVVSSKEDIAALEIIAADTLTDGQYCDVMLIDVEATANGPRPLKLRERIRADGPTITPVYGNKAA